MELVLLREPTIPINPSLGESYTPGVLYINGLKVCVTCEDADRKLEKNPNLKVYGKTAIPRGRYKLSIYNSPKHGEVVLVHDVPGYDYVEIHGGNKAEDSLGCILVGKVRTTTGICDCPDTVRSITNAVKNALAKGEEAWLEIK